jgi:hypothetical protein
MNKENLEKIREVLLEKSKDIDSMVEISRIIMNRNKSFKVKKSTFYGSISNQGKENEK